MTYEQLLRGAVENLRAAGKENPVGEARELLCAAGKITKDSLPAKMGETCECSVAQILEGFLKRRLEGEPLQYILGFWEFYGLEFKVGPGVLIPRADSEILVDTALAFLKKRQGVIKVADLCSGSGALAIALAENLPQADITAVEYFPEALAYLEKNNRLHGDLVKIIGGDALSAPEIFDLDLVISNPPYLTRDELTELSEEVEREPVSALDGGEDGLIFYRQIAKNYRPALKPDGLILFEIGYRQADAVKNILRQNGYENIQVLKDYGKNDRCVFAERGRL